MTDRSSWRAISLLWLLVPAVGGAAPQQGRLTPVLHEDFGDGWRDRWTHQRLSNRRTRYDAIEEFGDTILMASSRRSASALVRTVDVGGVVATTLRWRWRIEQTDGDNRRERERRGDDYVARVFVVFGAESIDANTEAICYVWAANEPVGSAYPSPYARGVATVVLQSGDDRVRQWVTEERDVAQDYRRVFGKTPIPISAIAIMVDSDNTRSQLSARFDDIGLEIEPSSGSAPPPAHPQR